MASTKASAGFEHPTDEVVNTVVEEAADIGVERFFTIPGRDPFEEIEWEIRDAFIPGKDKAGVRAEGRRVPEVLVADRDEHRRAEVLPRPHGLARSARRA